MHAGYGEAEMNRVVDFVFRQVAVTAVALIEAREANHITWPQLHRRSAVPGSQTAG
jgi:hypothetical protein